MSRPGGHSTQPLATAARTEGPCFICDRDEWSPSTGDYSRCASCGHEMLAEGQCQRLMVNHALGPMASRPSVLIRHQSAVLRRVARSHRLLLDVGSGSGHFLAHNREAFSRVVGVEISDPSVDYARGHLGLEVYTAVPDDLDTPSVVTFWHSLEHMPVETLRRVLSRIAEVSDSETAVIVAVPNSRSFQYAALRERYAFYDAPNHLHQFSPCSLDLMMARHGFSRRETFLGLPYLWFGWVQGLSNLLMPIPNYWYYRRKRDWTFGLSPARLARLDLQARLGLCLAAPVGSLCCLLDLAFRDRRGTMTICYAKTR